MLESSKDGATPLREELSPAAAWKGALRIKVRLSGLVCIHHCFRKGVQMALFLGLARWEGGRGNPETPVPGCLAGSEDAGGLWVVTRLHHHLPTCPIHTALPHALFHMRLTETVWLGGVSSPSQRLWLDVLADGPSSPGIRCGASLGPHVL